MEGGLWKNEGLDRWDRPLTAGLLQRPRTRVKGVRFKIFLFQSNECRLISSALGFGLTGRTWCVEQKHLIDKDENISTRAALLDRPFIAPAQQERENLH